MRLTIEMDNPQEHILEELTWPGITQESVGLIYALIIAQCGDAADWPRINGAIRNKWQGKSALGRVKKIAWRQVEVWQRGSK